MSISKKSSYFFILLLGLTSLFADITYEGGRSVVGPFLGQLGASAAIISFVAGLGELIGYGIRFISGYLLDKSQRYWFITLVGYSINLFAIPLLALATSWEMAAALIVLERLGKAIRLPARDAMLSHAAHKAGAGHAFGIHEAMDKLGAMMGPLLMATILFFTDNYRLGFSLLFIPAIFSLLILLSARNRFPDPLQLEIKTLKLKTKEIKSSRFWIYMVAASLMAAGYADFPLIAFHFVKHGVFSSAMVPVTYAMAMALTGLIALILGHYYERQSAWLTISCALLASFFSPFIFWGDARFAIFGIVLWSIGFAMQGSLMRAFVATQAPVNKRGSAYGIFNMVFGISWFLGSALMGLLYDASINYVVFFSIICQCLALPFFLLAFK